MILQNFVVVFFRPRVIEKKNNQSEQITPYEVSLNHSF